MFKPKDEEPYGRLNPKVSVSVRFPFPLLFTSSAISDYEVAAPAVSVDYPLRTRMFNSKPEVSCGVRSSCSRLTSRSYVSEAAASLLDERLSLNIVPRTQLVSLSSPAFFYDWLDRNAAKKGKPLPEKIGSMQYFLHGYTDASDFLRKHPWPGRAISDTFDDDSHRKGGLQKKFLAAMKVVCGSTGAEDDGYDDDDDADSRMLYDRTESRTGEPFYWTPALQDNFREELEKYVVIFRTSTTRR